MPKVGMEPVRRKALIDAAIVAIGERGSLDVTMSDIAGRAGVSSALAHHYFGAKDDLLQATMRHLLGDRRRDSVPALAAAEEPRARLDAIIAVNFSESQFRVEPIAAWLAFYVEAQRSQPLHRLLQVYVRRLRSNLLSGLRPLLPPQEALHAAEGIAALIDGLYIRRALHRGATDAGSATALVGNYLEMKLETARAKP